MKEEVMQRPFLDMAVRYLALIAVAVGNLWIFYFIFTPLTLYPVYFLLNLFFDAVLMNNIILVNEVPLEIIRACIAGSAYYLLLILNLSTPNIKIAKRIKMVAWSFAILLAANILRILLLSSLIFVNASLFDFAHVFFWYFVSIIFVIAIWFAEVKIFKIKKTPFYSDLKFLYNRSSLKKKKN